MEGDRSWVIEETCMEWWWRRLIRERWREWVGRFSSSHRSASKTERRGANAATAASWSCGWLPLFSSAMMQFVGMAHEHFSILISH